MRIGKLAAKAVVSVRALRYYEEQYLLASVTALAADGSTRTAQSAVSTESAALACGALWSSSAVGRPALLSPTPPHRSPHGRTPQHEIRGCAFPGRSGKPGLVDGALMWGTP